MGNEKDEWAALHEYERSSSVHVDYHTNSRQRRREFIDKLKDVPCVDCRVKYPSYVMDFDHVRGEKVMDISDMIGVAVSMEKLLDEIAKCEVVCSNCHRERTHRQRLDNPSGHQA